MWEANHHKINFKIKNLELLILRMNKIISQCIAKMRASHFVLKKL